MEYKKNDSYHPLLAVFSSRCTGLTGVITPMPTLGRPWVICLFVICKSGHEVASLELKLASGAIEYFAFAVQSPYM